MREKFAGRILPEKLINALIWLQYCFLSHWWRTKTFYNVATAIFSLVFNDTVHVQGSLSNDLIATRQKCRLFLNVESTQLATGYTDALLCERECFVHRNFESKLYVYYDSSCIHDFSRISQRNLRSGKLDADACGSLHAFAYGHCCCCRWDRYHSDISVDTPNVGSTN